MAFDPAALNVIGYAHGFTLWHYQSADPDIDAPGYFAAAGDLLRPGDFVLATRGPAPARHGLYAIADRPGHPALVTIADSRLAEASPGRTGGQPPSA